MAKENRSIISNTEIHDSSSKVIFKDNILSAQFFRDYADMEILRSIKPEDVEDVSSRYVPLYTNERNSDTVKKIDISKYLTLEENENQLNLPLYIVSVIEHKTKVEYNVIMQVLRYIVYIWEDYEKEMNRQHYKGFSSRKDFRYPPVLPIVYYEGEEEWMASTDLSERILCGELLGKYLPHFKYQLIRLHDYSNAELLEKKDEISVAMLINKIQSPEDMAAFIDASGEQVEGILKDTPDYLLDTIAKVMRTLLYRMELSEEKAESMVSMIKERKMARLFENVTMTMDDVYKELIRRQVLRARQEAEEIVKKELEEKAKKELEEIEEKAKKERKEVEEKAKKEREKAEKERDTAVRTLEVYKLVSRMLRNACSEVEIRNALMEKFFLTEEEAKEEYRKVVEED